MSLLTTHDLPFTRIIDLMLNVKAGANSIEAANPRHEHEWKLWKTTALPEPGFRVHPQIAWAKLQALSEGAALASPLYR